MIHFARIDKSPRLQQVLAALRTGPKTTLELHNATGSMAPHTDIAELRSNGFLIERQYKGKSENGRQINVYTLIAEPVKISPEAQVDPSIPAPPLLSIAGIQEALFPL